MQGRAHENREEQKHKEDLTCERAPPAEAKATTTTPARVASIASSVLEATSCFSWISVASTLEEFSTANATGGGKPPIGHSLTRQDIRERKIGFPYSHPTT